MTNVAVLAEVDNIYGTIFQMVKLWAKFLKASRFLLLFTNFVMTYQALCRLLLFCVGELDKTHWILLVTCLTHKLLLNILLMVSSDLLCTVHAWSLISTNGPKISLQLGETIGQWLSKMVIVTCNKMVSNLLQAVSDLLTMISNRLQSVQ